MIIRIYFGDALIKTSDKLHRITLHLRVLQVLIEVLFQMNF